MKRSGKFISVLIALVMVISLQTSNVFCEEQIQPKAAQVEQPSIWALDDVQWSAIYGIFTNDMYLKYQSKVNRSELYTMGVNLYEKITGKTITPITKSPFTDDKSQTVLKACAINILSGKGKFEPKREITRLETSTVIFNVIKAAEPKFNFKTNITLNFKDSGKIPAASMDIVKYFISKSIIKGKAGNIIDINSNCSRQELMIFARRAYEFVSYESGKDSKGDLWKISDDDSSVYLLGSIHVADPSMYPLSKNILSAFEKSDDLVVEADVANQTEGLQYMQQKMVYSDDNTLDKNIPKELYDKFVETIKPLGIPEDTCKKYKPWAAALLIQNIQLAQQNLNANLGIDLFFTAKATGKKKIIEIEGLKFQVDMFDTFSKELQLQFLTGTLNPDKEDQKKQTQLLSDIVSSWKSGDASKLGKLLAEDEDNSPEAKEFNDKMWSQRNSNMSQKVKGYLADPDKKTYFVVVGAGHVNGTNGILTQLKDGYKIEQIK